MFTHPRGDRRRSAAWIGTPYRHQASLKGVGCDCLGLVRGVWRGVVGPEPEVWRLMLPTGRKRGRHEAAAAAALRHLVAIERDGFRPGDVLLFRWRERLPLSMPPL